MDSDDNTHPWGQAYRTPAERPRPLADPGTSLLMTLLVLVALAGWGLFTWTVVKDMWYRGPYTPPTVVARGDLAQDEQATIDLYNKTRPSVVNVTTLTARRNRFSLNVEDVPAGTGSGFVWDDLGHIVTNYHVVESVVEKGDKVTVTLDDHSTWEGTIWGTYPDKDLAVIQINAPKERLRPLPLGESAHLQVGQKTFAIGNPFGLDQTLTTGIVSALGREIQSVTRRPIKGMIQTDAAINPGNSGGPLLDSAGRLIGVNTAIFSPSGSSAGIGFAIPVDDVRRVVDQLVTNRKITRPGLGVRVAPDQTTQQLGKSGVLVVDVVPGGPAETAGLLPTQRDAGTGKVVLGDLIVAIDGKPIKRTGDLFGMLESKKIGDEVSLDVQREDKKVELRVRLAPVE
jgi:S1-C subfamily serine protease